MMLALGHLMAVLAFFCCEVRGQNDTDVGAVEPTPSPVILTMEPTWQKLDCYDNLTVLQLHLDLKDPLFAEIFTLCPNTTFEIGYDCQQGGKFCLDGQSPLLPRANTRINCGDDGKAANNCILSGGIIQMSFDFFSYFEQAENVEINGVTFSSSEFKGVVLFNGGDIIFRDCVFMVRLCTTSWEPGCRCPDFSYTSLSLSFRTIPDMLQLFRSGRITVDVAFMRRIT
jgi:hypothetical protein